jgi:CO/xanthine dehydrogenase Mo-binding subunit
LAVTALALIGSRQPRTDGGAKVTGRTKFTADLDLGKVAHVRLHLSPHPAANITAIDLVASRALPGVIAVLSGPDLPELPARAAEALLARGRVYFAGQPVIAVVAETEAIAADAVELVHVTYDPLPAAITPEEALADGAPNVLEDASGGLDDAAAHGAAVGGSDVEAERRTNVTSGVSFSRGDPHGALASAEVVVQGSFDAPQVHQGFLEPHVAAARYEPDGTYTVWSPTQGVFPTRNGVANALGARISDVRVIQAEVGGGFGGKVLLLEPLVALLARLTGRTVRLALTRTEEFQMGRGAPAFRIDLKIGADRDGTMRAIWARVRSDNGAGQGGIAGLAAMMLASTYRIPNYDVATMEVATNKTPVAAYRAPGAVQAFFALESAVGELAEKIGMDPIALRLMNAVEEGDPIANGQTWPRIGFRECLEAARSHPLYNAPLAADEAIGVAAGAWLGGLEPAAAGCRVESDGTVVVQAGHSDISGTDTTLAMIAAQLLGIGVDKVRVRGGDSETAPYAGMAGGSKTIYTVGLAVYEATLDARRQLLEIASEEMEVGIDDLDLVSGEVFVKGVPERSLPIGQLAGLATRFGGRYQPVLGRGQSAQVSQAPMFTVQVAKIKVDAETGAWQLLEVAAFQDVGRALNPAEIEGQVHGGALQAMARALGEEMIWNMEGTLQTASFIDYGIPTIEQAAARFDVHLIEIPSPHGPFGAKGVGEPPAIPGPAVLANAIRSATGRRLERMPFDFPLIATTAAS